MIDLEQDQLRAHRESLYLETHERLEFVDITERVAAVVESSGVREGFVNVQTRHTTTAILMSEHEPLLMEDLKGTLERAAPCRDEYRHDDFTVRTVNMCPDEEKNGHAHCKALFLRSSECLNIVEGRMDLGQWQRIFLLELDRARPPDGVGHDSGRGRLTNCCGGALRAPAFCFRTAGGHRPLSRRS